MAHGSMSGVDQLLSEGVIQRVPADATAAARELQAARTHLDSAEALRDPDPVMAFTAAYEGSRKAISALMRAEGFRIRSGPGAHVRIGRYGETALAGSSAASEVANFDLLRRVRNQAQYDAQPVEPEDIADAITHGLAIIAAVEERLSVR